MLHFLRRIRRTLINSGSMKKYTLYAIGEIALVVIGILIALSINNWNESRKNYNGETNALIELKIEFDHNYTSFIQILEKKKEAQEILQDYLSLITDNSKTIDQKSKIERSGLAARSWDPGNAVLNSLLSTGNIEYIKNDPLKYLLQDWNKAVYGFDEHAISYKEIAKKLRSYEKLRQPIKMVKNGEYDYVGHSNLELQEFRKAFVEDFRYHNLIITCVNGLNLQINGGFWLEKKFIRIRDLLDEEILRR
jgi:hypothetical protein